MNTTRIIPVGQSRRISPLERAVAMRLLASGRTARATLARALAVDPADVAAIMRGLEEEGVVVGLCEDGGRKRTAWILASIDTKMIEALRKANDEIPF
jgi:DNA-binding MarR family transcriptional regulator